MYYCYKYFAPRGPLATFGAAGPGCLLEFGAGGGGAPRLIISRSLGAAASGSSPRSDFSFVLLSSAVFRSSEAIHGLFMSIHPPRSGSIVQVWGPKTMDVNRCRPRDSSPKCVGGALATSAREKPSRKAGRLVGPIEQSRPIIQTRLGGRWAPNKGSRYRRRCYRYRPTAACPKPIIKLACREVAAARKRTVGGRAINHAAFGNEGMQAR
jgi:hypothetical protein